ncbi:CML8 [Symbiodinium sp. CCMP2592]|nr:CML8 [Symbiodinium sp. CCMP2592]
MQTEDVVRNAFLSADVDKSGTLDVQEFGRLLKLLNPSTWSDERLQRFFLRADKDGSGRVDLQETLDWLLAKEPAAQESEDRAGEVLKKQDSPSKGRTFEMTRLMRAFEEADINRDGCLDKEEFASVLMSLDPKKFSDPKKLTVAFQRADDDHNGELDTREVEAWLGRYLNKKAPDEVEELYMLLTWRDGRATVAQGRC